MFLTDSANIKEVLLFPAMKPVANSVPGAADAAVGEVAEQIEQVVLEDRKTISSSA